MRAIPQRAKSHEHKSHGVVELKYGCLSELLKCSREETDG